MSELSTQPANAQQWSSPHDVTDSTTNMQDAQKLYKTQREAEQRLIYNQLTANNHKSASKNRNSRMASIVAQQRIVI